MHWKPFVVKTDNNPLTYILTILNLDASQHYWVESLAGFAFSIKYQKGRDNAVAHALSHLAEALKWITIGTVGRADAHDPVVAEANERIHKLVEETAVQAWATHAHVNVHVMEWVAAQQEDPMLKIVMEWISSHKAQDLKHLLGGHAMMEEGVAILREQKKFTIHQGAHYYCHTLARELEEALWFVVPITHRVVDMNGCHRNVLGIKANCKHCPYCKPGFGGLALQCGWRRWSVAMRGVFYTRVPEPRLPYKLSGCLFFGAAVCGFHWHWDNEGTRPITTHSECFGLFWPLHETCYGICDSWSDGKKLLLNVCTNDTSWSSEHWSSSWVTEEPTLRATSSVSSVSSWAFERWELYHTIPRLRDRWNELTKCWCGWLGNWVKIRKQTGLSIYKNWCMLTTPQDHLSPDTAHTTWCLGNDCAYPSTFIFPLLWAQKTPVCQSLCYWLMWVTVQSLQGSTSAVHMWGWR